MLTRAIVDEPPAFTKEGGIFRPGYHEPLDELRNASIAGKEWIAQLQEKTIEETGIKNLKIRYTGVFGYFFEVTKSNLSSVPATWHRKQTVANGERYITPELKEVENKILGADERSQALVYELFIQLRDEVLRELSSLQETAAAVATIDVLAGLAETARLFGYCKPTLAEDLRIRENNVEQTIRDIASDGTNILTIGQYLQPTPKHLPVSRWAPPEEFLHWKNFGLSLGLGVVESGPLVRSSYHADEQSQKYTGVEHLNTENALAST